MGRYYECKLRNKDKCKAIELTFKDDLWIKHVIDCTAKYTYTKVIIYITES